MFSILLDSIDKEEPQLGYQGGKFERQNSSDRLRETVPFM